MACEQNHNLIQRVLGLPWNAIHGPILTNTSFFFQLRVAKSASSKQIGENKATTELQNSGKKEVAKEAAKKEKDEVPRDMKLEIKDKEKSKQEEEDGEMAFVKAH
mgnify:CR=1 FL=1